MIIETTTLKVGDTWSWTEQLDDYPATDYTLKFALRGNAAVINLTASADGNDHAISETATTTAAFKAGEYHWEAYVEKGSGASLERYTVGSGRKTVEPALFQVAGSGDARTHAEKVLAALEATIEGQATKAQASMSIMGRAIQYLRPDELVRWHAHYERKVAIERGGSTIVRAQFGRG